MVAHLFSWTLRQLCSPLERRTLLRVHGCAPLGQVLDGRLATWITGAVSFLASVITAFTGYLIQTNFDSQWIAGQAKDGFNSMGIGAFFNTLNTGQAILLHVALLPLVLGVIVAWHVILVRRHGVVPPIDEGSSK